MRVNWGGGGGTAGIRAAVEFVHSFSFSPVHIYLRKNLDNRQDGHVCVNCVYLANYAQQQTRKNNSIWYLGGFGCDWALSKKTCKLYIFVMMQWWPD